MLHQDKKGRSSQLCSPGSFSSLNVIPLSMVESELPQATMEPQRKAVNNTVIRSWLGGVSCRTPANFSHIALQPWRRWAQFDWPVSVDGGDGKLYPNSGYLQLIANLQIKQEMVMQD